MAFAASAVGAEVLRGARVPFITHEAEAVANKTTGTRVAVKEKPTAATSTPELEASGRAFVALDATGEYLDIPVTRAADGLVLRHCIPDAPSGGGATATLSLYVNGKFRQSLTLSSRYNWLYGHDNNRNGQSNDPAAGTPHVFWDDTRFRITGGVAPGDTLRLQKDERDTAAFYRIDLVDLEAVPLPLAPPPTGTFLSVVDFGATANDETDDTPALLKCIEAARVAKKTVWVPSGSFQHTQKFTLDGVAVQGAGMWHTTLVGIRGQHGFMLRGKNPKVADLTIESTAHTARGDRGGQTFTANIPDQCTDWLVENVWIAHTHAGFWLRGVSRGVVRGCRVYLTYADGINLNRGSHNNVVEHNYVRGVGDDGLAILSQNYDNPTHAVTHANTLRSNTVIANWWGHNCDLAGGGGHVVEDNYLADNSRTGCFTINLTSAYPMFPLKDSIVRRNTIVRGGGSHSGQRRGAFWILADGTPISGLTVRENEIRDSVFSAIHIRGGSPQEIVFEANVVDGAGEAPVRIETEAKGSGSFVRNVFKKLPEGATAFSNRGGDDYAFTERENRTEK